MYYSFFAGVYRSVRLTVPAIQFPFVFLERGNYYKLFYSLCVFRTRNVHLFVFQVYPPVRQTFNLES